MVKKNRLQVGTTVDCACVIHSAGYNWVYVEKLYNMLCRTLSATVRLHVYTEHHRSVPPHLIKHCLEEWPGIAGPKQSWWYKMQLFNPAHHQGNLLYFDLDCVMVRDITWITELPTDKFWTIRDFRYLQKINTAGMNSSVMWWNVSKFQNVWHDFAKLNLTETIKKYHGDQDYLNVAIDRNDMRFMDPKLIESYRWQSQDGGYNFAHRQAIKPGSGAHITDHTAVLVFHGRPKPHEVQDPLIQQLWA